MPKRIVFCADGTWNGPESETGVSVIDGNDDHGELLKSKVTNVVKLFANLSGRSRRIRLHCATSRRRS